MEFFEDNLIELVRNYPSLYKNKDKKHTSLLVKENCWREIAKKLNKTEAECKKRWRSLRDSFIKLQRTHGGRTRWPYHNAMRFLLPHIEPKSETLIKRETSDSETEEEVRHRPGQSLPDLFLEPRLDDEDDFQPKKPRLNSSDDELQRTDPDELFLLSCASTLKRLNAKQNAVARLKIQQVLYEAEFGTQMELPYVTPASDCDYENVDGSVE
ncbi:transcription factor Adf-1 isoform X1 [Pieris rapae]|uniref:transcription factor Adf-1 isoform X1 n=1 Tax=Pieris rapae TaxID=64459 RepID=UPI001E27E2E1|nr:transcription factor Adf-1 isoform X1 [Pieris rapae]